MTPLEFSNALSMNALVNYKAPFAVYSSLFFSRGLYLSRWNCGKIVEHVREQNTCNLLSVPASYATVFMIDHLRMIFTLHMRAIMSTWEAFKYDDLDVRMASEGCSCAE